MTQADTTATGVCVRHRRQPKVATCVTCGSPLCARCIVRTPVGFKCASCTAARLPADISGRRRRPDEDDKDEDEERQPGGRRWAVAAAIALTVLALLAVTAFALSRQTTDAIGNVRVSPQVGPIEVPVQFQGAGSVALGGILSLPAKSSQPAPAVLIIGDFGSVDRDGLTPAGRLPDPLYADLARSLTARGFASLRFDPRGQGQSMLPPGSAVQLPDLVGDGAAGLRLLAGRAEIDAKRLTIAGDGWGGLVALQLAAQDNNVTGVVLVSTPGRPVVDTIADQLRASALTAADGQRQVQQLRSTVAGLLAGSHLPSPAALETALRPILQPDQEAFLRALFALTPAELAKQVHLPTLVVRGGQDPAITAADADALASAVGTPAQVLVASAAGHTLAVATPTSASPGAAATRDVVSLNAITNWISRPSAGSPPPPMVATPNGNGH